MKWEPRHRQILAVDPGLTGALAWLELSDENKVRLLAVADVPTYLKKTGTSTKPHLDLVQLAQVVRNPLFEPTLAVIEEVGAAPGQGVTSMFRFGYVAGALAGVCAANGIDPHFVRPQHWQKWARKRPTKGAGREQVLDLFPDQARLFKRARDHNRADAVLIGYAYFCESTGQIL